MLMGAVRAVATCVVTLHGREEKRKIDQCLIISYLDCIFGEDT